jgi:hypothetical protein
MRKLLASMLGLAVGSLMLGGVADAATPHDPPHLVSITGNIFMYDEDTWPESDDVGNSMVYVQTSVGSNVPSGTASAEGCVDDEVRVVVSYRVDDSLEWPGWVLVTPTYRLYEGASCGTTDLDGAVGLDPVWVGPNESVNLAPARVHNTAEGGDWAEVTVSVRNSTTVPAARN